MPVALTPNETWPYVLEAERKKPKEDQTVFQLKAKSGALRAHIKNIRFSIGFGSADNETLLHCLGGWENFKDSSGNPIKFKTQIVEDETLCAETNLDYLSEDDCMELVRAINKHDKITEEEAKNSDSGDTSSPEK
jgi:hypothetical protein